MSWMENLYKTYEHIAAKCEQNTLWPISHFVKNAHIEVVITKDGGILHGRTKILDGQLSPTLIPATEASAGRSGSKIAPHPLCDELGYCAADCPKTDINKSKAYLQQIKQWADSEYTHPKVQAIYKYLSKGTLWTDLQYEIDFPISILKQDGRTKSKIEIEKTFVRWRVEEPGNPVSGTWEDHDLMAAWIAHDSSCNSKHGFCYISGRQDRISQNHPRFIRWPGDGAKLVSSNDNSGFTFRGRFTDSKTSMEKGYVQTASIGFLPTQKAHNALRWLINTQGYRNDGQVYVTWAISGKSVPDPLQSTFALFDQSLELQMLEEDVLEETIDHAADLGRSFATKFNTYLSGFSAKLDPNEQIVVMGLDSATPGRMGIIYYRTLLASEFLERIQLWHFQFAWPQRYSIEQNTDGKKKASYKKTIWPVSSPAPRNIAEAAYGDVLKSNATLKKNLLERIMPAIVDGQTFPRDIMQSAVRRASNRNRCEHWEWEQNLGIACALYRGFYQRQPEQMRRNYSMSLEETRNTRDYLYGRLLAIAEKVEEVALSLGSEVRSTTAARMMQRFADRPFSTWRNIFLALQPYMQRLQSSRGGFLTNRKKDLDTVLSLFQDGEFEHDKPLSGEFLLGYHCQRMSYRQNNSDDTNPCEKGE